MLVGICCSLLLWTTLFFPTAVYQSGRNLEIKVMSTTNKIIINKILSKRVLMFCLFIVSDGLSLLLCTIPLVASRSFCGKGSNFTILISSLDRKTKCVFLKAIFKGNTKCPLASGLCSVNSRDVRK